MAQEINKVPLPPIRPVPTEAATVTLAKEGATTNALKDLTEFKKTIPGLRTGLNFNLVPREDTEAETIGKRKFGEAGNGTSQKGEEALPMKRRKKDSGAESTVFDISQGPASLAQENRKSKGKSGAITPAAVFQNN